MNELIFSLQSVRLKFSHTHGKPTGKGQEITRQKCFLPQAIFRGVCHRMAFCKCTFAIGNGSTKKLRGNGCSMSLVRFTQGEGRASCPLTLWTDIWLEKKDVICV